MNPFIYEVVVLDDAIDFNLHVNNTMYVKWMQEAAFAHSDAVGDTDKLKKELGFMWVVKSHSIEYFHPAYNKEKLHVKTWVQSYKKSASIREYEFLNEKKAILARARSVFVCLNSSTLRPMKIPENVLRLYTT